MAIPKINKLYGHVLKHADSGKTGKEFTQLIIADLNVSINDQKQKNSSGELTIKNRIRWVIFNLRKAKLMEISSHGKSIITNAGQEIRKEKGLDISDSDLISFCPNSEYKSSVFTDIDSTPKLKGLYNQLINDENFDRLELGLHQPNIFEILRISKAEIRHSNFLAWILNPKNPHGIGDVFLKKFLREIFSSSKSQEIDQIEVNRIDYSNIQIRREWKNIDLLIILDDIVICLENKFGSKEHSQQLSRYKKEIDLEFPKKRKAFVYLTPEGDSSEEETETYIFISYTFITESLNRILDVYQDSLSDKVKHYLTDYSIILKREIMGNDELTELANKIYKNHNEILDFLFDKKPEIYSSIKESLQNILEENKYIIGSDGKHYLRFTTKEIEEITYYNKTKNGWKNRESFLFEFSFQPKANKITFKTAISPCDAEYNSNRLAEILMKVEGSKKPIGSKWLVHHSSKYNFKYDKLFEDEEVNIYDALNKIFDKVSLIVSKYETQILKHKQELLDLKNV